MGFLIVQDLRSKFTTHGSILCLLWKFASGKLRWLSWNDEIEGAVWIFIGLWITFWWLFKAGQQKSILQISTRVVNNQNLLPPACFAAHNINVIFEFPKVTHACAFCFCLRVSRPFASDTSPKRIDREGLGKRRTGTRQVQNVKFAKPMFSTRRGDTRTTAWACAKCLLFENLLPVASYSPRVSDLKVPIISLRSRKVHVHAPVFVRLVRPKRDQETQPDLSDED